MNSSFRLISCRRKKIRVRKQFRVLLHEILEARLPFAGIAELLGAHLFYPRTQTSDVITKSSVFPLSPGNMATGSNISASATGIEGVSIDVQGLPSGVLEANDFEFRISDGRQSWQVLQANPVINVLPGQGVLGSSRVTVQFPPNSVQDTWLQVTLMPSVRTGLSLPSTYFFGSLTNDVIDAEQSTSFVVNDDDFFAVVDASKNSIGFQERFDINNDGRIDQLDVNSVQKATLDSKVIYPFLASTTMPTNLKSASWTSTQNSGAISRIVPAFGPGIGTSPTILHLQPQKHTMLLILR